MRTSTPNKFAILPDNLNKRNARKRTTKPVRTFKTWNINAKVLKAIEQSSPTTTRKLFKALIDNHTVSDTPQGLSSVRRVISQLQKYGILISDQSILHQNSCDYGLEAILYLNPDSKYIFL